MPTAPESEENFAAADVEACLLVVS